MSGDQLEEVSERSDCVKLLLGGDVMTGRGIDQALAHPSDPRLYEPYVNSSKHYLLLAEEVNGPIPRAADEEYIWGDALEHCRREVPDARIVNLETSITTSDAAVDKGINYRMHPENVGVLAAARIDCCALANNHVLDWGEAGLLETMETLKRVGIRHAGAGRDHKEAETPAVIATGAASRVVVFSFATVSSGVLPDWRARGGKPGVALLEDLSAATADRIAAQVRKVRRPGDIVVVSIHWGGNWGYEVPESEQAFARRLIDEGAADVVHGHSSHHQKGIEVFSGKLILYGCGDLINDYEGIGGREEFRNSLALLYFATVQASNGALLGLRMIPLEIRRFRLTNVAASDAEWLRATMDRESGRFGCAVKMGGNGTLNLRW